MVDIERLEVEWKEKFVGGQRVRDIKVYIGSCIVNSW